MRAWKAREAASVLFLLFGDRDVAPAIRVPRDANEWRRPAPSAAEEWPPPERRWNGYGIRSSITYAKWRKAGGGWPPAGQDDAGPKSAPKRAAVARRDQSPASHMIDGPGRMLDDRRKARNVTTRVRKWNCNAAKPAGRKCACMLQWPGARAIPMNRRARQSPPARELGEGPPDYT